MQGATRNIRNGRLRMEILEIKNVEDCFDGSLIKEILLASEITKDFIYSIGDECNIQYFDNFARPFFKIRKNGLFDLKGIEGNKTMRVHLKNPEKYSMEKFCQLVQRL